MDRARAAVLPLTADDRRTARAVGRHARLELAFDRRRGRTVLARSYAEAPLRVGGCFQEGDGVHVIVASSAPGIFGGDVFEQTVRVGGGARVRLTSQSSLQVHPSPAGDLARVRSTWRVDEGGSLECTWHPLIPFAGSRLDQEADIRLTGDARLWWSDAFTTGRTARGERWAFHELAHQLEVWRDDRLEYLERYRVAPAATNVRHPWIAERGNYFGTMVESGSRVHPDRVEALHRSLVNIPGLRAAADALDDRLMLVRLAADLAAPFHQGRDAAAGGCA